MGCNLGNIHKSPSSLPAPPYFLSKPWNYARSLGMVISSSPLLHLLLSSPSHSVVPRVTTLYVPNPVLICEPKNELEKISKINRLALEKGCENRKKEEMFSGFSLFSFSSPYSDPLESPHHKFDLRFIVMLHSFEPATHICPLNKSLRLLVYKQFWIRLSNNPFSMNEFDDYQKHFTVMNYKEEGVRWMQMSDEEFISLLEKQNARRRKIIERIECQVFKEDMARSDADIIVSSEGNDWLEIKKRIYSMIREVFVAATSSIVAVVFFFFFFFFL
jgi:hypothetical protein